MEAVFQKIRKLRQFWKARGIWKVRDPGWQEDPDGKKIWMARRSGKRGNPDGKKIRKARDSGLALPHCEASDYRRGFFFLCENRM